LMMSLGMIGMQRTMTVSAYRNNILANLSRVCMIDAIYGRDSNWRFDVYDSVSFKRMVFQFWRPVESFYKDTSFIE